MNVVMTGHALTSYRISNLFAYTYIKVRDYDRSTKIIDFLVTYIGGSFVYIARDWKVTVQFPEEANCFSFLSSVQAVSAVDPTPCSVGSREGLFLWG
jgi:hypothetical protein